MKGRKLSAVPAITFPSTWRLLDDVELMDLPDPEYLIEGVIPRKTLGSVYAPPGAGKTTLMAPLALSVATGADFFGHRVVHRGAVCYAATEDVGGYKVRLRTQKLAAGLPLDQPVGVFTFPEPIDLMNPTSVDKFSAFLEQQEWPRPLELIVLDTFAGATAGAKENDSDDMSTAVAHAQRWVKRLGATVIIVHHTNAGGTRERGHSALRGAADFMIALNPSDDLVRVENSKQRNGPEFKTLTLKMVDGPQNQGRIFKLAADVITTNILTPAQSKVLTILGENFSTDGATKSEWQRSCADISERTFHRVCKVLIERELVTQVGAKFRMQPEVPR